MRRFFIAMSVAAILSFTATMKGQETKNLLALNATTFVKQYLVLNSQSIQNDNPYLITYRRYTKGLNFRIGVGGNKSYSNNSQMGSMVITRQSLQNQQLRLGIDRTVKMTEHWLFYYGLDLIAANEKTKQITEPTIPTPFFSKTIYNSQTQTIGVQPNMTLEYRLNKRVGFFTETCLNMSWSKFKEKQENPDLPGSSMEGWNNFGTTNFRLPLSVFFYVRF